MVKETLIRVLELGGIEWRVMEYEEVKWRWVK